MPLWEIEYCILNTSGETNLNIATVCVIQKQIIYYLRGFWEIIVLHILTSRQDCTKPECFRAKIKKTFEDQTLA